MGKSSVEGIHWPQRGTKGTEKTVDAQVRWEMGDGSLEERDAGEN